MISPDEWTRLVQSVDALISALRSARSEAKKWQARAAELERHKDKDERVVLLEVQSKDRELDRYRKERKKIITQVSRLIAELDQAREHALEKSSHD